MHADPLRRGERFCAHHRANTSLLTRLLRSRMSSLRMSVPRAGSGAAYVEWSGSTGPAAARMAKMKSCHPVYSGMRMVSYVCVRVGWCDVPLPVDVYSCFRVGCRLLFGCFSFLLVWPLRSLSVSVARVVRCSPSRLHVLCAAPVSLHTPHARHTHSPHTPHKLHTHHALSTHPIYTAHHIHQGGTPFLIKSPSFLIKSILYVLCLVLCVLLAYFMYSMLYSAVSHEFESILEIQSEYRQSTVYSNRAMRVHAISNRVHGAF
jgi:hypothetical protein